MREVDFRKGDIVFRQGEIGNCFYQIEKGSVGVYLKYGEEGQLKLADMMPGQYFGEMAIIEYWPRSATIVAEEDLCVVEIPKEDLNAYFAEQPDKIVSIMKQLSGRIRSLTEDYDEVKAFLREGKNSEAPKKAGLLAKIKQFLSFAPADWDGGDDEAPAGGSLAAGGSTNAVTTHPKGQVIFHEGDTGDCLYAVHNGSVNIYDNYGTPRQTLLTTVYVNRFFGEMGLIDQEIRSATAVTAEDDTVIECIRGEDLAGLFKTNPVKVDMILRHLSASLRRLTRDYMKACEEAAKAN